MAEMVSESPGPLGSTAESWHDPLPPNQPKKKLQIYLQWTNRDEKRQTGEGEGGNEFGQENPELVRKKGEVF